VRDVRDEKDRLVKRLVSPKPAVPVAVAIARLTDTPARHLVMAVKSADHSEAPPQETVVEKVAETPPAPAEPQLPIPATFPPREHEPEIAEIVTSDEEEEIAPPPTEPAAPEAVRHDLPEPETPEEPGEAFSANFDNGTGPVRFVWKTDGEGRFTDISPEFASAVGPHAADIVGRTFQEVADIFDLDPSGEINASLKRHDTWSGKSVSWPVQGTVFRVPVDLAALPSYNRQRDFEGYRGFGIVRMGERKPDPDALGLALADGVEIAPAEAGATEEAEKPAAMETA
jgi:hypothetical protein